MCKSSTGTGCGTLRRVRVPRNASVRFSRCVLVLLVCLSVARHAKAEPSASEQATARSLFDQGRALATEGKYEQACPKFEESQRLHPGIGTLFNLASCYE